MIQARLHHALATVSLQSIALAEGWKYPTVPLYGLKVEKVVGLAPGFAWKNLPQRSYTVSAEITIPELVELLAWEANEWEAIELARSQRRRAVAA